MNITLLIQGYESEVIKSVSHLSIKGNRFLLAGNGVNGKVANKAFKRGLDPEYPLDAVSKRDVNVPLNFLAGRPASNMISSSAGLRPFVSGRQK